MSTYNINTAESYITASQDGGTIFFQPLLPSGNTYAPGQIWLTGEDENNTTLSCQYPDGSQPLYLNVDSISDGSYVGATFSTAENSCWSIESDGSLQLINNGTATGLYAVIPDTGILTLSSTASTKWKFSKTTTKGSTR